MNTGQPFDVYTSALAGTNLIEASAGTGKTWNLCGLYLRLLLERDLPVQRILVVTFTKAATAELRERIRSRIAETLAFVRDGVAPGADPFVERFVATMRGGHGPGQEHRPGLADADMATKLELALHTFDEASIFTIHGFCQRALADTPFTSQMPLALEAIQDDSEFIAEAANDFWRRRIAGDTLTPALAACLVQRKDSPDKFAKLLKRHLAKPLAKVLWPGDARDASDAADPGERVAELVAAHAAARAIWHAERDRIVQCVLDGRSQLNQGSYKPESIALASPRLGRTARRGRRPRRAGEQSRQGRAAGQREAEAEEELRRARASLLRRCAALARSARRGRNRARPQPARAAARAGRRRHGRGARSQAQDAASSPSTTCCRTCTAGSRAAKHPSWPARCASASPPR